jgi:hypothetical protein
MTNDEWKAAEEKRRERNWNPTIRWQVLQESITWAESQSAVRRNTKESRLTEQQEKLAQIIRMSTDEW